MRRLLFVVAALGVLAARARAQSASQLSDAVKAYVSISDPVIALKGVRVIDGTGAAPAENQTVVIENGRIKAVGSAGSVTVPANAKVMDLAGHTVVPGYVGMHDHIHYSAAGWRNINLSFSSPRLYLAAGVTTIRTTGSLVPYEDMNLKHDIDAGKTPGPRMHLSGPYITGPSPALPVMAILASPEGARRVVDYWADEGATWFKLYTTIHRAEMKAAVDEAHKRGMKITGHLCSVGFKEAVELGIDNLEHGLFVNTEYDPAKKPDMCPQTNIKLMEELNLDSPDVQGTFKTMIAKGVSMTSTLPVIEALVPGRPAELDQRMLDAMYPVVRENYVKNYERMKASPGAGITEKAFKKALAYEYAFVKAGGLLGAGVDNTGNGGALAGLGDQRNFEILEEAGFTPVQAIKIMSFNGAKILGADKEIGSITPGKYADLVLINGNPVQTARDIRKVVTVFKGGVGYDPAKLYESVKGQVGLR